MSKIDNPPIKENANPLLEDAPSHAENIEKPARRTSESTPQVEHNNLRSRPVSLTQLSSADTLCEKAHALRKNGEIAKAYLAYREAANKGSLDAKFWLGEIDRPFIQGASTDQKAAKPDMSTSHHSNICQDVLLLQFSKILDHLHLLNPEEYDIETINIINRELTEGHCNGFSTYFLQLSLLKNPDSLFDRTEEYALFAQKICDWDGELFEPPAGFSYAQDYQDLTDDEKKNLNFTNELKEFISIIRFGQHTYHEDIETENAQSIRRKFDPLKSSLSEHFNPESSFFYVFDGGIGQLNYDFILGDKYVSKIRLQTFNPIYSLDSFLITLKSYLTDTNAASISLNIGGLHRISIIFRENKYYLFDPNSTSEEPNFDPRYSARSYDSLEALNQDIQSQYQNDLEMFSNRLKFDTLTTLDIIERKEAQNFYLSDKEEYERLDIINLQKLSESLPADQFDQMLQKSMEIEPYDIDLRSINSKLYTLLPPLFFKNATKITFSAQNRAESRSVFQAAPFSQFESDRPVQEKLAFRDLGEMYAVPFSPLYNPEIAFHFFQLSESHYDLAICHYLGIGTEKDEDLAITYLLKEADNGNKNAINMIGYFFKGQKQIIENPNFTEYLLMSASNHVANALYHMGYIYRDGLYGQEADPNRAESYLSSEELSDNPEVLYDLSHLLITELKSNYRGYETLRKAADLGHLHAQLDYGDYLTNTNTDNNQEQTDEAMYYYQQAADQGDSTAQYKIGLYLYNKDESEGYRDSGLYYLNLSAEQGFEDAITFLAMIPSEEPE